MKVLITGAAGFIGSHLCERYLSQGDEVIGLDNLCDFYDPAIKQENLSLLLRSTKFSFVLLDILDQEGLRSLFDNNQFDQVIHLAAMAGVRPSIEQPMLYTQVNIIGTQNLLELCRIHNIHSFIFASSSSIYGNNEKVPFAETDKVDAPISPYAATKKAGELLCHTYHHLFGINVMCLRFFTVYGPRQRPDLAINKFARLIREGKPIPVFGDGSSRRDYTFIADIVSGVMQASQYLLRNPGYYICNLGESKTIDLRTMIKTLEAALQKSAIIEWLPMQPGDVNVTYADISYSKQLFGYQPTTDFTEGIASFVHWFDSLNQ